MECNTATISELQKQNITIVIEETVISRELCNTTPPLTTENIIKKRGRKPKGGKLIVNNSIKSESPPPVANVILHLKCSMQDLNEHNATIQQTISDPLTYNPTIPPSIMTYDDNKSSHFSMYDATSTIVAKPETDPIATKTFAYVESTMTQKTGPTLCELCSTKIDATEQSLNDTDDASISVKEINAKLKQIKVELYKNIKTDKKSACFWCTYDYDNPACYIPKYELDGQIHGYGSFCRPECAVAFLMEEILDDSTKFERYHLLNHIYSKVYDYKKNIKPAPNPYYLLDKFYGNLTIQEYRKLLKTEHMLLVIDKPMTRILPELHEDREDFLTNIYGGKTASQNQMGMYKVKRQSEKQQGPSKTKIMKENFGL
jgi:hypothetical protein